MAVFLFGQLAQWKIQPGPDAQDCPFQEVPISDDGWQSSGALTDWFEAEVANGLQLFSAPYTGFLRVIRLLFVAATCPQLRRDALNRAREAMRSMHTPDDSVPAMATTPTQLSPTHRARVTSAYVPHASLLLPGSWLVAGLEAKVAVDADWVDGMRKASMLVEDRLALDLKTYTANLIKESIRMGYMDMADHLLPSGSYGLYMKAKEFCSAPLQLAETYLKAIRAAFGFEHPFTIAMVARQAESSLQSNTGRVIPEALLGEIRAYSALNHFCMADWSAAADTWLTCASHWSAFQYFHEGVSRNDFLRYFVLAALASWSRQRIRQDLLANAELKSLFYTYPRVRHLLESMVQADYATFFDIMRRSETEMRLDLFLHGRVGELQALIQQRMLVQFLEPYSAVSLKKIENLFSVQENEAAQLVETVIQEQKWPGKLDKVNQVARRAELDSKTKTMLISLYSLQKYRASIADMLLDASLATHGPMRIE